MKEWIKDIAAMAALILLFVLSFVWAEIITELVK